MGVFQNVSSTVAELDPGFTFDDFSADLAVAADKIDSALQTIAYSDPDYVGQNDDGSWSADWGWNSDPHLWLKGSVTASAITITELNLETQGAEVGFEGSGSLNLDTGALKISANEFHMGNDEGASIVYMGKTSLDLNTFDLSGTVTSVIMVMNNTATADVDNDFNYVKLTGSVKLTNGELSGTVTGFEYGVVVGSDGDGEPVFTKTGGVSGLNINAATLASQLEENGFSTLMDGIYAGNDTIDGTEGNDFIESSTGNDKISGEEGDDYLDGGDGDDQLLGGAGSDTIVGGTGNDKITDTEGDNAISDTEGNANVVTGSGADSIVSGSGNDKIVAGDGDNTIDAGEGNNNVTAGSGSDAITAGAGNDKIVAGDGDNTIDAGDGNNNVTVGSGDDAIVSGSGSDKIVAGDGDNGIDAGDGANNVLAGSGNDAITAGSGNDKIVAGDGDNMVDAGDGNNNVTAGSSDDSIATGSGNDKIVAGNGDNMIDAGAGNDTILSGSGSDLINGGAGADKMTGGAGADHFVFDNLATGGVDTVSDFNAAEDFITLDTSVFGSLDGFLESGMMEGNLVVGVGAHAADVDDYLIFDTKGGKLYYDADGAGSDSSAIQIAVLKGSVSGFDYQNIDLYSSAT